MLLPKDPLQPVPWTRMEELSEKLLSDAPNFPSVYGLVRTALKWKQTNASERIELYTTNDRFEDCAIVGIYRIKDSKDCRIILHCFSEDTSSLRNALLTTGRIKWNIPESTVLFTAVSEKLLPIVQECFSRFNFEMIMNHKFFYKWKTPDQVDSCDHTCPSGVRLAPLGLECVELIKSKWVDRPGASEHLSTLVENNRNLGVYSRSTGELCAYILLNEIYTLAILHTIEGHRRKGYAKLLCNALSQQLLRDGIIAGALIHDENSASLKLFESLNYNSSPEIFLYVLGKATPKTLE